MTGTDDARDGSTARRPRRAVRRAGTVGGDDANLVSVLPALTPEVVGPPSTTRDPRAPTTGPRPGTLDRSADDTDVGWGERGTGTDDERLTGEKPPHW